MLAIFLLFIGVVCCVIRFRQFKNPFARPAHPIYAKLKAVHKQVVRTICGRAAIRAFGTIAGGMSVAYLLNTVPVELLDRWWRSDFTIQKSYLNEDLNIGLIATAVYLFLFSFWASPRFQRPGCRDWITAVRHLGRPIEATKIPISVSNTVDRLAACTRREFFEDTEPFYRLASKNFTRSDFWFWVFESIAPCMEKNKTRRSHIRQEISNFGERTKKTTKLFGSKNLVFHYGKLTTSLVWIGIGLLAGLPASFLMIRLLLQQY